MEKYLRYKFKRIENISIHLQDTNTIEVNITERHPVAMWYDTLPLENFPVDPGISNHCYFMDINGTIFAEAPQFSGDAYFKYYGGGISGDPLGQDFLPNAKFPEIDRFVKKVISLSLKPQYLVKQENGSVLALYSGTKIYFDDKDEIEKTTSNLELLMRCPELLGIKGA